MAVMTTQINNEIIPRLFSPEEVQRKKELFGNDLVISWLWLQLSTLLPHVIETSCGDTQKDLEAAVAAVKNHFKLQ